MFLEDPFTGVRNRITSKGQFLVLAITEPEIEFVSENDGQAYMWNSQDQDIDAGDTMLLLKNTSDTILHITRIIMSAGNAATRYEIHIVTADITPTGTAVTGFNMNTASGNVANAIAKADESVNTQGSVIYDISLLANTTEILPTPGLLLAKNISIGVDQVTESTAGNVCITGHF